jgi:hypothetical protein
MGQAAPMTAHVLNVAEAHADILVDPDHLWSPCCWPLPQQREREYLPDVRYR